MVGRQHEPSPSSQACVARLRTKIGGGGALGVGEHRPVRGDPDRLALWGTSEARILIAGISRIRNSMDAKGHGVTARSCSRSYYVKGRAGLFSG